MKVRTNQYLYIERRAGKSLKEGALYAKMFQTYEEAKTIFDHVVNDVMNRKGEFVKSTPDVPDCFISTDGIQFEITTNL